MKKTLHILIIFLFCTYGVHAQCEASSLNSASPKTADNSGTNTVLLGIVSNEYFVLNGLNINDTYSITSFDLAFPSTEAFLTLRSTADNSVIASGYTPLMFTASTTEFEIHFFDESDCNPQFDLVQLSLQNETTLGVENNKLSKLKIITNFQNHTLSIVSPDLIDSLSFYDINGRLINKLTPKKKKVNIKTNTLNSGLYFVHISTAHGRIASKKVLINNN